MKSVSEYVKDRSRVFLGENCIDTLSVGYLPLEPVGQGAYGLVFSALRLTNHSSGPVPVAVKKLCDSSESETSRTRLFRELLCMKEMNHPSVLKLIDVLYCNKSVYIVSELLETDLGSIVKSKQALTPAQMLVMFYQLIDGIRYIHDCGIIHRDLKPRNILLSANCDVKICDFGLARLGHTESGPFTEYVCTRWYRAPEILIPSCSYTNKIDIFSLGCIVAEVVGMKPFLPGKDSTRQYDMIIKRLGQLTEREIAIIPDGLVRKYINKLNVSAKVNGDMEDYIGVIPSVLNPSIYTLIRSLVRFDPRDRLSADDIIHLELFREFQPHRLGRSHHATSFNKDYLPEQHD